MTRHRVLVVGVGSIGERHLRCFAATGCEEHADNPPLEDHIKGTRGDNGHWTWEVLLD